MRRNKTESKTVEVSTPMPKPKSRGWSLWKWMPVVLLLFVVGLAVAFQGIGAETGKTTPQSATEQSAKAKPSLTPETEVLAYVGGKNDWQPQQLNELAKSQEFQVDNHLCYVDQNGFIRMNPGVDIALLSEADRFFEEDNEHYPESKDVVRYVDKHRNHLRHDRMGMAKAGERFYFQGRLYEAASAAEDTGFVKLRRTGTVLRPPYYPRSYDDEDVDPRTWRSIELEKKESDGSLTKVDLLRPTWWLEEYGATEGASIYLDLTEICVSGNFQVKSIDPCPDIEPGKPGTQPVIGKFTHENAVVLDLTFEGESKPLGVTANHPIWSETHQKYLPAGEFKIGEEVKILNGTSKLLQVAQRPGRHTVYNLEVHKDHVYRVGESGILVHNKQPAPKRWGPTTGAGPLGEDVAKTFRGGSYTELVTQETTTLYRVYGGKSGTLGGYWTRTPPSGPLQSRMDLVLLSEWGNTATEVVRIKVPKGTTIFEGFAAPQSNSVQNLLGGGSQVYIPRVNPDWIVP